MSTLSKLSRWFDAKAPETVADPERIDWFRCAPFIAMHVGCLAAFAVGISVTAVLVAAGLYVARMFFITAFYHRYFSHRAFKTSRWFQFIGAFCACSAGQRGPLWWASHHRVHHLNSDGPDDAHSPGRRGFWYSHLGWFMTAANFHAKPSHARDWERYPELRFLDRFDWIPPLVLALALIAVGSLLGATMPELATSGAQLFVWGFLISTVFLYHCTYTINSLAHSIGTRRFSTRDDSRNNLWLALLTLGEGWHNNHHHYPVSARQGFYWWEVDLSYYGLRLLAALGLIRDLRPVPRRVLSEGRLADRLESSQTGRARP